MRWSGIVCAVLCWLTLGGGPAAAAPEGAGGVLVRPAPGSSTAEQGGYFLLDAEPGDVVTQDLELRNDSAEPIEVQLAAVDAVTGPLGGASYGLVGEEVSRTGTWITLDRTSVRLEPDASATVPFTVRVPDDARGGEHLAGLSVAPAADAPSAPADDAGTGASVDVRTRRVVAVQVDLPGPAEPELAVRDVRSVARPQGLYLEIELESVGTALTRGEGTISVPGDDFQQVFTFDTFVPGTSIAYPVAWPTEPREDSHEASVEIRYEGKTATWDGTVVVGDEVLTELADRQVQPATADAGRLWLSQWLPWIVAALGVLTAGVLAYRLGRREASRPQRGRRRADP